MFCHPVCGEEGRSIPRERASQPTSQPASRRCPLGRRSVAQPQQPVQHLSRSPHCAPLTQLLCGGVARTGGGGGGCGGGAVERLLPGPVFIIPRPPTSCSRATGDGRALPAPRRAFKVDGPGPRRPFAKIARWTDGPESVFLFYFPSTFFPFIADRIPIPILIPFRLTSPQPV